MLECYEWYLRKIDEYNPGNTQKVLIVFDDLIAGIVSNKTFNPEVIELFIRGRKLDIFLVSIGQSYFAIPKDIRLYCTHYFILKASNRQELWKIAFNHPSDIDLKVFRKLYNKCPTEPYSFLVFHISYFSVVLPHQNKKQLCKIIFFENIKYM